VKDRLNRQPGAYAFLMVDIRSEWTNTYLKFRLLADYTDIIVGVAEHSGRAANLVEQGYFTALGSTSPKTRRVQTGVQHGRYGCRSTRASTGDVPANATAIFKELDESLLLLAVARGDKIKSKYKGPVNSDE